MPWLEIEYLWCVCYVWSVTIPVVLAIYSGHLLHFFQLGNLRTKKVIHPACYQKEGILKKIIISSLLLTNLSMSMETIKTTVWCTRCEKVFRLALSFSDFAKISQGKFSSRSHYWVNQTTSVKGRTASQSRVHPVLLLGKVFPPKQFEIQLSNYSNT